jgi:hypothetical protein
MQAEARRRRVVHELLETERNYVRDLGIMIHHFKEPLLAKGDPLCAVRCVLCAWCLIVKALCSHLWWIRSLTMWKSCIVSTRASSTCLRANGRAGVVHRLYRTCSTRFQTRFCEWFASLFASLMAQYPVYTNGYEAALTAYGQALKVRAFSAFVKEVERNPALRYMELTSFLIEPGSCQSLDVLLLRLSLVQRIARYPLLLSDLIQKTFRSHPDFYKLCLGSIRFDSICSCVCVFLTPCKHAITWRTSSSRSTARRRG